MRSAVIALAAGLVIGACGLAHAQQTIKGKISIQIAGTAATSGTGAITAPPLFKVEDPHLFDAVKQGDEVSVTTDIVNGVPTIKSLKKE